MFSAFAREEGESRRATLGCLTSMAAAASLHHTSFYFVSSFFVQNMKVETWTNSEGRLEVGGKLPLRVKVMMNENMISDKCASHDAGYMSLLPHCSESGLTGPLGWRMGGGVTTSFKLL